MASANTILADFNPKLDLVLERIIDVPPSLVWEAWTTPEHLKVWFCPRPWGVSHCELDLRPGGKFLTVMRSPEGQEFPNVGCYLDVVPNQRLVWTDALQPGFRPSAEAGSCGLSGYMTGIVTMEPHGKGGTRYVAMALHNGEESRKKHEEMGFREGWGAALDQMVEHIKTMEKVGTRK